VQDQWRWEKKIDCWYELMVMVVQAEARGYVLVIVVVLHRSSTWR